MSSTSRLLYILIYSQPGFKGAWLEGENMLFHPFQKKQLSDMFSRNLRVSLIEDQVIWADKEANMQQLRRNLQNVPDDTDLVVLPEMFSTGMIVESREQAVELAERPKFTAWQVSITLQSLALFLPTQQGNFLIVLFS